MDLTGRSAVVTGGGGGIGNAVVRLLAERGAGVQAIEDLLGFELGADEDGDADDGQRDHGGSSAPLQITL